MRLLSLIIIFFTFNISVAEDSIEDADSLTVNLDSVESDESSHLGLNISFAYINHFGSDHYKYKNDTMKRYNDTTMILSYKRDDIILSYFKNSFFKDTYYLGLEKSRDYDGFSLGYSFGLSKGYYLKKFFKKGHFLRRTVYKGYDGWDAPVLPMFYLFHEKGNFRTLLFGTEAIVLMYNFGF